MAEMPNQVEFQGTRILMPRDPQGGGTWAAVNEWGLTLTLLNDYSFEPKEPRGGWTSRGLLVRDLSAAKTIADLLVGLSSHTLAHYRPFQLLVLSDGKAAIFHWDGQRLQRPKPHAPLSSSGFDSEAALTARRTLLQSLFIEERRDWARVLPKFHQSHLPERGPLSPCMHRPEAVTVSSSWIEVTRDEVRYSYAAGPPCRHPLGTALRLPRRQV